jgi:hypothetical protein
MGGIDCFKKQGKGIILMDNGACIIAEHTHDVMIGHNIIFRDKSLTSIIINANRTKSVCFRSGPYLLYLNMTKDSKNEGLGFFVYYSQRLLMKLKY